MPARRVVSQVTLALACSFALAGCSAPAYLSIASFKIGNASLPGASETQSSASAFVVLGGVVKAPASLLGSQGTALSPVPNAGVEILDQHGNVVASGIHTDAQGHFTFQGLKPANAVWIVKATFQGANAALMAENILQAPTSAATLNLTLDAASTLAALTIQAILQSGASAQTINFQALPAFIQLLDAQLDPQTLLGAYSQTPTQAATNLNAFVSAHNTLQVTAQQVFGSGNGAGLMLGNTGGYNGPMQAPAVNGSVGDSSNNQGKATTFAGNGVFGNVDGTLTSAEFASPTGIAVDTSGNVYVSGHSNNIRKVDSGGNVTTLAGNGIAGYVDGVASTAEFNSPFGMAVDPNGNTYIADTANNAIRKLTPTGWVSTVVGGNGWGFADGSAATAKFNNPIDVKLGASGNLLVTDRSNNRIRQINLALAPSDPNFVTTVAGNGTPGYVDGAATSAEMIAPTSLCADASGDVYIWDRGNARVRLLRSGTLSTIAGNGIYGTTPGNGTAAEIGNSVGITEDPDGNLFLSDQADNVIQKIDPAHNVTIFSGDGAVGYVNSTAASAEFNVLQFITSDVLGNLYVPDGNNVIRKIR